MKNNLLTKINNIWLSFFTSIKGLCILFGSILMNLLIIDEISLFSVVILTVATLIGLYIASAIVAGFYFYMSWKKNRLDEVIQEPPGFTWTVYNQNQIKLGEIDEIDYHKAKYAVETSPMVFMRQFLNLLSIPFYLLSSPNREK